MLEENTVVDYTVIPIDTDACIGKFIGIIVLLQSIFDFVSFYIALMLKI